MGGSANYNVKEVLPGLGVIGQPTVGTQFVGPGTYLGPIPTLTLFLSPNDPARNAAVCAAFVKLPTQQAAQAKSPNAIVIPLRWLLTKTDRIDTTDCTQDVDNYDFFRAATLLGGIAALTTDPTGNHPDITGSGPYLVEQFSDATGSDFLLIDFSKSKDQDFQGLGPMIASALSQQSDILSTNNAPSPAVQSAVGGTQAIAAAKSNLPGWLQTVCGAATSVWAKMAEVIVSAAIPPAAAVIVPLEAVTNAGCTPPAQNGQTGGAAPAPAPAKAKGKK